MHTWSTSRRSLSPAPSVASKGMWTVLIGRAPVALVVLLVLVIGTGHGVTRAAAGQRLQRGAVDRLYAADSPFNQKIPAGAKIDARSAQLVNSVVEVGRKQGFLIALKRWTIPVYFADRNTPRYRVRLKARWAPARWFEGVPIPTGAAPDPANDAHMVIIDTDSGCEYDFWQIRKNKRGRWKASWGNSLRTDGDGIFPKGLSARGSGFALPAGMIWPEELAAGRIEHALQFSYNYPKKGGPVSPATESDGTSSRNDAIPEGARLQLDPTLELDGLGLRPYERIIAEALQQYGMFLADHGGGVELQAVHPLSYQDNPYDGLLPDRKYVYLDNIPLDRLQVLELPAQIKDPGEQIVQSGCGKLIKR